MAYVPPQEKDIVAELRYEFDGKEWAAVVTRADIGEDGWQLWYQRGDRWQKSGTFTHGKALVNFLREEATKKFEGYKPAKDTLEQLKNKSAWSVVPDCHHKHSRYDKCQTCPYEPSCFPKDAVPPWMTSLGETGFQKEQVAKTLEPDWEEPEEVFMKRLKGKVKSQWGMGEDDA